MEDQNCFQFAEEKFCEMTDFLKNKQSHELELSELENHIKHDGRELMRRLLVGHLEERGVGDVGLNVTGTDGVNRTHKRIRIRTIKTIFGEIKIKRLGYSAKNTSSLFPLDAMLNLPVINVSYVLQKNLVLEVIKSSFDESVLFIKRWTGVSIPKRQAKKMIIEAAKDFEQFYEHKKVDEKQAAIRQPLIILTSDGKGVVMRHEDLREETKKRAENKNTNENNQFNLTNNRKSNSKRIATVASVYEIERFVRKPKDIHDEFFNKSTSKKKSKRPVPIAKRVWAGLEASGEYIISEMFEEALQRVNSDKKEWVVLVDGALNQIKTIKKFARKHDKKLTIICDIIHVLEYIWKAGKVLNDADNVREWVSKKFYMILNGKSSYVASGIRRSATCRKLEKLVREPIDSCARYLLNHSAYLHYDKYLKLGYPIATGVIEGACRYLVKDRMEITGARWSLLGAEALLKLRSLKISDDFEDYWKFYEKQQYYRNYEVLYQNPSILKMSSS
jgi:hypothetical protein